MKKQLLILPFLAFATALSAAAMTTGSLSDSTQNARFSVFPNPTEGVVHIKSTLSISRWTITDLSGSVVMVTTQISNQLDLSSLAAGTYVLSAETNEGKNSVLVQVK